MCVQAAQVRKTSFVPSQGPSTSSSTAYDPDVHQPCTVFAGTYVQQVLPPGCLLIQHMVSHQTHQCTRCSLLIFDWLWAWCKSKLAFLLKEPESELNLLCRRATTRACFRLLANHMGNMAKRTAVKRQRLS